MKFVPPTKQDLTTQTIYSELLDRVKIREASRSLGHAPGGFVSKTIKGVRYIYFQASLPGGEFRQVYIGKQSPDLVRLVDLYVKEKKSIEEEEFSLQRLCAQLRVGGALFTEISSGCVLAALSNAGLFQGGGGVGRNPRFARAWKSSGSALVFRGCFDPRHRYGPPTGSSGGSKPKGPCPDSA